MKCGEYSLHNSLMMTTHDHNVLSTVNRYRFCHLNALRKISERLDLWLASRVGLRILTYQKHERLILKQQCEDLEIATVIVVITNRNFFLETWVFLVLCGSSYFHMSHMDRQHERRSFKCAAMVICNYQAYTNFHSFNNASHNYP
jgi:hypothetical protein